MHNLPLKLSHKCNDRFLNTALTFLKIQVINNESDFYKSGGCGDILQPSSRLWNYLPTFYIMLFTVHSGTNVELFFNSTVCPLGGVLVVSKPF